jgi:hypothetical protein
MALELDERSSRGVSEVKRLDDPEFEPTDEDLIGLSRRAFPHVREEREEALRRLRVEIATARQASLERLYKRWPGLKAQRLNRSCW